MFSLKLLFSSIISIFFTSFTLKKLIPILRLYLIDNPNKRSSHTLPKLTGGGISFVLIISIFSSIMGFYLPLKCLPLAIIGFVDDLLKVPRLIRFFFQIMTVLYLVLSSSFLDEIHENSSIFIYLILLFVIIISGIAIINFVNFMDGIDGLVSGSLIIIFLLGSILLNYNFLIVVGALLGFILWNWDPSKIFMGDVGSTFLGALLVGLLLTDTTSFNNTIFIILVSAPLIGDALICVLRRLFNNQNIFDAHSSHLYQRLFQAGWSHSSVAILYMSCILILVITIIIDKINLMFFLLTFEYCIAYWLDQRVAIPFKSSIKKR